MIVRTFHHKETAARSYLISAPRSSHAVLIDPVLELVPEYSAAIERTQLKLECTIETHLHDDHVSGSFILRARYGSRVLFPAGLGAIGIDAELRHGDHIGRGKMKMRVLATPGQTAHAISLYVPAKTPLVFTGDVLHSAAVPLPEDRSCYATLLSSIRSRLFTLPDTTVVHPGHDPVHSGFTNIQAERMLNPFARETRSLHDFIATMERAAVRPHFTLEGAACRNLIGGAVDTVIRRTRATALRRVERLVGPRLVNIGWLVANTDNVRIVDFREAGAYQAAHILGSARVTSEGVAQRTQTWSRDQPLVSINAETSDVETLQQLGFRDLYRVKDDPDAWRRAGLTVVAIPVTASNLAYA